MWNTSKYFTYSILIHVIGIGTLITLSHWKAEVIDLLEEGQFGAPAVVQPEGGGGEEGGGGFVELIPPFQGISYSEYRRRKRVKREARKQAQAMRLLGRLQGMSFKGNGSGAVKTGLKGAQGFGTGGVGKGYGDGEGGLTGSVRGQRFTFRSMGIGGGRGVRRMTQAERLALRAKFRALKREFRKLYSRALLKDPHLSLTVSLQAVIDGTGYLSVSKFRPKGSFREASEVFLKREMSHLIEQVFVAKDLRGTIIRWEGVFTR